MGDENNGNKDAESGPGKLAATLLATAVGALLSLGTSYLITVQKQSDDAKQRSIGEQRLAYGKLAGASIVLKQTEYFRWVAYFSQQFYSEMAAMEEPGSPTQRDDWQQALAGGDRQASLALESAKARRDLFEIVAQVENLFPKDLEVQERAVAVLNIPTFPAPVMKTTVVAVDELRHLPKAQVQPRRDAVTRQLRDEEQNELLSLTNFLNESWQIPIEQLRSYIGAKYLGIKPPVDARR